jgi:hypothetical protein
MPPIPRQPFKSDEDYERAVATSKTPLVDDPGTYVFIPEDKLVAAFQALHDNHHAVGMGVLHDAGPMSEDRALLYVKDLMNGAIDEHFDYVDGRPFKMVIRRVEGGYSFNSRGYNQGGPDRRAEEIIAGLGE